MRGFFQPIVLNVKIIPLKRTFDIHMQISTSGRILNYLALVLSFLKAQSTLNSEDLMTERNPFVI